MKLPVTLALTKAAAAASRLLGRGGGHALPGLLAEKFDPHLAKKLAAGLPNGVILVTGTNGKTTTTKLIASALTASGEKVLTNSTGSNLKRGVVSALIGAADLRGKIDATVALFEVDEASLRQVAPELMPQHIVVLNLFRDQLDRYGELDTTAALIGLGIGATRARLHLNADDPLVASLAKYASEPELVSFFGIEGLPSGAATAHQTATDSDRCPQCRSRLKFSRVFYGHIGHYRCPEGHFSRPQPSVSLVHVKQSDLNGADFVVAVDGKRHELHFSLPGTYNLYNALASISLADGFGIKLEHVAHALARTEAAFGRVERVQLEGRTLCLLLIKNPAGFSQVIETFLVGQPGVRAIMAINDLDADGRDVSWLWDVPLEALATSHPPVLIAAGIRSSDMALRLHYAGLKADVAADFEEALQRLLKATPEGEVGYILPSYTAMLQIRKILEKRTEMQEVWK
jgi:UDP-N-acetylmuramyl tripeptide synthase